jgi:hypothetical protein
MRDGESILSYWARAKELWERCHEVGFKVESDHWLVAVISGLPASWETTKQFQSQSIPTLTEDHLLGVLLEEEDRQKNLKHKRRGSDALPSDTKTPWRPRSPGQGGKGARGRGKGKAPQEAPPKPKKLGRDGAWGELGPAPRGYCHGCHEEGHFWGKCTKRPGEAVPKHWRTKEPDSKAGAHQAQGGYKGAELLLVTATAEAAMARVEGLQDHWILDSGATYNFTPHEEDFVGPLQDPLSDVVRVGNGHFLAVAGMGDVWVTGEKGVKTRISNVHLVLEMHSRLLSVPHLDEMGAEVVFKGGRCRVSKGGNLLMQGSRLGRANHGLYKVQLPPSTPPPGAQALEAAVSMRLVHQRLAHVAPSTIKKLLKGGGATGLKVLPGKEEEHKCEPCQQGKVHGLPFP